jgi:hypothetical protein
MNKTISTGGKKMAVFWYVASCDMVEICQRLGGAYYLHHHPDDGDSTTSQKTTIFILAVITQMSTYTKFLSSMHKADIYSVR